MKVLYLIQTHKNPAQIYRLVKTIKTSSPNSMVLISHNYTCSHLDQEPFSHFSQVEIIPANGRVRGDFSMMQTYLDAYEWLKLRNIDFDWLINITGQDYPTQPLSVFEEFLAITEYHGFLNYLKAFGGEKTPAGVRDSKERYLYQYWRSGVYLKQWQIFCLKPLKLIINNIQPFIRINWSYDGVNIGLRAWKTPFNEQNICYKGSFFQILSKKCVKFLDDFTKDPQNTELIE